MAEINVASQLGFGELAKRLDPKGDFLPIFEAMDQVLPEISRIPAVPCNKPLYQHIVNRRTSLPTGSWIKFGEGVASQASTTQVVTFNCALLKALSEVNADLIDSIGGSAKREQARRQEDMAFVQGLTEQVWSSLITGTTTSYPERFDGFQQYLTTLSQTMVIDGGNSGGTSIYVIDFDTDACFFIYPDGVERGQYGLVIDTNADGGNGKVWTTEKDDSTKGLLVYRTLFQWYLGLVVRDELRIGRIANINATLGGPNTFDENDLIELLNLGKFRRGTTILCTKEIRTQMQVRLKDKNNVNFDVGQGLSGVPVLTFMGAPIFRCDAISTSEGPIT
ncbi:MAG: hypothetical protein V2A79_10075 [Planctomycetota bacterium]